VRAALLQGRSRVREVRAISGIRQDGRLAHELAEEGLAVQRGALGELPEVLDGAGAGLLGCCAFLADGSIVAEAGALTLVQEAATRDVPVHFFVDTLKLAPWLPPSKPSEGTEEQWDIVPPEHIDHVITEDGIRRPHQLLAAAADLAPRWRAFEPPERRSEVDDA
jgi:hypothetical protein